MENVLQNFYSNKKILVTGGAGFIGSHLVEELVKLGAKVTILDNFVTGFMSNLRNVLPYINIQYADITSPYSTIQGTAGKDVVFHLAAFISVPNSIKYPDHCSLVNEIGTENTLNASIRNGVKSFVFSSSAAIYGNKDTICQENDFPNPQSPYATSKLIGENLCKAVTQNQSIATTSLRYFNVYGDRQNPSGDYAAVVAKFTQSLKTKSPITIFGTGEQTRDFTPVSLVVHANLVAGMQYHHVGEIINVASGKSINLHQLIAQLEKEYGIPHTEIIYKPTRDGDIHNSIADNSKLLNLLENNFIMPNKKTQSTFAKTLS